jgi:hypothetical protein
LPPLANGRGDEMIVDTAVRKVWQLEPDQFRFENKQWASLVDEVVKKVRSEFGLRRKINADIYHAKLGYTPLLFVRDRKKLESGLTSPFVFLGPCNHVSHEGTRPISIVWNLKTPLPSRLLRLKSKSVI